MHPPRSASGSPGPHSTASCRRSHALTCGSPPPRRVAVVPRAGAVFPLLPPDHQSGPIHRCTRLWLTCSPERPNNTAADIRSTASPAPTPPAAFATVHPGASSGSDSSIPPSLSGRRRTPLLNAYSPRTCSTAPSGLRAPGRFFGSPTAALLGPDQIRHLRVLVTQLLGFLRLAHIHAAVLYFRGVERVLGHATSPATSSTLRPASTCFSASIICASVCLLFDILPFPFFRATHTQLYAETGKQAKVHNRVRHPWEFRSKPK
jgi:hypothetical protein